MHQKCSSCLKNYYRKLMNKMFIIYDISFKGFWDLISTTILKITFPMSLCILTSKLCQMMAHWYLVSSLLLMKWLQNNLKKRIGENLMYSKIKSDMFCKPFCMPSINCTRNISTTTPRYVCVGVPSQSKIKLNQIKCIFYRP